MKASLPPSECSINVPEGRSLLTKVCVVSVLLSPPSPPRRSSCWGRLRPRTLQKQPWPGAIYGCHGTRRTSRIFPKGLRALAQPEPGLCSCVCRLAPRCGVRGRPAGPSWTLGRCKSTLLNVPLASLAISLEGAGVRDHSGRCPESPQEHKACLTPPRLHGGRRRSGPPFPPSRSLSAPNSGSPEEDAVIALRAGWVHAHPSRPGAPWDPGRMAVPVVVMSSG